MLLLLLGCPPKPPPGPPDVEGQLPVLPAPDAPIYSVAPGSPADSLVAWAVDGLTYDDALGGAAAGLAEVISDLGGHDEAAVRWACLRAGWPYGVGRVAWERTPHDTVPAALVSFAVIRPICCVASTLKVAAQLIWCGKTVAPST